MEVNPNAFYKQIWFWILIIGILVTIVTIILYLYTDLISLNIIYALTAVGFFLVFLGATISYFSFKSTEPTLHSFTGEDLKVKLDDLPKMSESELYNTFEKVTGVKISRI